MRRRSPPLGRSTPATLAKAHFAAGYAAVGEGDFPQARADFELSLEHAKKASHERAEGAALAQLAWLAMAAGEGDRARELAEQSAELAERAGDKLTTSGAVTTLADLAVADGKGDEAIQLYERGLALRRALGDQRLVANSLVGLGRAQLLQEDYPQREGAPRGGAHTCPPRQGHVGRLGRSRQPGPRAALLGRRARPRGLASRRGPADWPASAATADSTAEWAQALAAVYAVDGRTEDAARLCASAEALRETTGAELYPAEAMIQERFLTSIRADAGFPAALEAARTRSADELIALAAEASVDGIGPTTVASPAVPT